ncbi:Ig-like domain-containing protein [Parabacteroides sp. OttesenSCG-928-N08]|nr:Ig-like domain-containing protein [Parabacteroides sp. OttesenSCG-928-N08]
MKKLLFYVLLALIGFGCSDDKNDKTVINMTSELEIKVGDRSQIEVSFSKPEESVYYTFSSSDCNIASVDNKGLVIANNIGHTDILLVDDRTKETVSNCKVKVLPISVESISLSHNRTEVPHGGSRQFTAKLVPENSTNQKIKWSSSDKSVLTIGEFDGLAKGLSVGYTSITATSLDGDFSDSIRVYVYPIFANDLKFDKDKLVILIGYSDSVTVDVLPLNATDKSIYFEFNSPYIDHTTNGNTIVFTPKEYVSSWMSIYSGDRKVSKSLNINSVGIDHFIDFNIGPGTEGNTTDGFYSYLRIDMKINVPETIYITKVVLVNEMAQTVYLEDDIGEIEGSFMRKFITVHHGGTITDTYMAKGWFYSVEFTWKGYQYGFNGILK